MALPHHNRARLCNLFLKLAWIRLRGGSVRLKRPMRLMCGSCILSALRVGRTEVTLVGRVPPKTYLGGYGVFARTAHSEDNPAGWASWQVICIRNGIFWSDDKSDRGAAPIIFGPCTLGRTWGTRPVSSGVGYDTGSCETRPFPRQAWHWLIPERPRHPVPARRRNLLLRQRAHADPTGQSR
jgi:hypothetical protein